MEFTVEQIAQLIGGKIQGDPTRKISKLAKIQEGDGHSLAFLSNPKYENYIYTTHAGAVIVKNDFVAKSEVKATLIFVEDPYTCFTALLEQYHKTMLWSRVGVEEPSYIGKNSTIAENHYRAAFSYIGNNCTLGTNVKIFPNVSIGDNVSIGNNVIIYAGVKICADTVIGNHVTIQAGAVIGSDGFGFAPQADGSYKSIPQVGNVVLGNHVDIGANTVIDRATMGSTVIEDGVKLDNLVQVAHNAKIGQHTVIASQAGISGSTEIGKYCMIGGQVGFSGHIKLANKTSIAAQSGIMSSVTTEGAKLFGSPAFEARSYLKSYTVFKKLPQLMRAIEELEEKIISLSSEVK
ncbi:MAG TPA: UDP-3-O-(3-hydroxymyristoyl)glucosamine N-acyltransferase [Cytophagaceae bacterium]|jgi:UDP-3-O-[3-hydroxymyristoyl] glucosamine N-acyltransferase|nr:UDP-3-O-(3-hydroxymyristoyl)glucosamine N-acyltransferase [Cytophagaceae bacterium]